MGRARRRRIRRRLLMIGVPVACSSWPSWWWWRSSSAGGWWSPASLGRSIPSSTRSEIAAVAREVRRRPIPPRRGRAHRKQFRPERRIGRRGGGSHAVPALHGRVGHHARWLEGPEGPGPHRSRGQLGAGRLLPVLPAQPVRLPDRRHRRLQRRAQQGGLVGQGGRRGAELRGGRHPLHRDQELRAAGRPVAVAVREGASPIRASATARTSWPRGHVQQARLRTQGRPARGGGQAGRGRCGAATASRPSRV